MLPQEALWLGKQIAAVEASRLSPMLDFGSATEDYRTVEQPWIDRHLFAPARARGISILHMDIKGGRGVDIVGDLADPAFLPTLGKHLFRSVVCANLLEHVVDRSGICEGMLDIVLPGGYVFITCPRSFPYHPDPIDTLFRPDIGELASLFPGAQVCAAEEVPCGSWWDTLKGPKDLLMRVGRMFVRFWRRRAFYRDSTKVAHLFKGFRVTCLVLRKTS